VIFKEAEIYSYLEVDGFKVLSQETRQSYDFETPIERIYTIGEKKTRASAEDNGKAK